MERPLQVRVRKIDTSYGVIIPKEVLDGMKAFASKVKELKDIKGTSPGLTFGREHGTDRF